MSKRIYLPRITKLSHQNTSNSSVRQGQAEYVDFYVCVIISADGVVCAISKSRISASPQWVCVGCLCDMDVTHWLVPVDQRASLPTELIPFIANSFQPSQAFLIQSRISRGDISIVPTNPSWFVGGSSVGRLWAKGWVQPT
jgi:hypothetical protein